MTKKKEKAVEVDLKLSPVDIHSWPFAKPADEARNKWNEMRLWLINQQVSFLTRDSLGSGRFKVPRRIIIPADDAVAFKLKFGL